MLRTKFDKLILSDSNSVRKIENHDCNLNVRISDICYLINDGLCVLLRRKLRSYLTISAKHPQTYLFLRSAYQIDKELRRHLTRFYHTIHPMSLVRYYWDCFMAIVYLLCLVIIPVEITIFQNFPVSIMVVKMMLDCCCYLDILMNFFSGYFDKKRQKIFLSRRTASKHYCRTFFVPDLLSSIPLNLILHVHGYNTPTFMPVKLILLLKLFRLNTALTHLQFIVKKSNPHAVVCFLIGFLFTLMYSSAVVYVLIMTSIWKHILYHEKREVLMEYLIRTANQFIGFLYSVEKDTVYNKNVVYMYLVIVWIFFGAILNILIFSKIIELYRRYRNVKRTTNNVTQEFRQYMTYKGLSSGLKLKIERFVNFTQQRSIVKEHIIWQNLSTTLKQEIMLHNCHKFVSKVDFFKGLPTDVMLRIVSKFHMEIFLTNDVIFQAGVTGTSMYFIYFGKVAVYTSNQTEICHLGEGGHFGEIALLINMPRTATVVAISECELYRLSRKDFLEAIEPYPEHKEKIWKLASSRLEKIQQIHPTDDQAKINLAKLEQNAPDDDNDDDDEDDHVLQEKKQ